MYLEGKPWKHRDLELNPQTRLHDESILMSAGSGVLELRLYGSTLIGAV